MTDLSLRTRCPNCDAVYRVQEEHLGKRARCAKCKDIFAVDRSRSAMAGDDAASGIQGFRDWQVGDVILDLYEVRELVGEGGFGKVYRVFHRDWQLDLAVKSPNQAAVASARGIDYLEREAETWVQLGLHAHTVSCHYVRRVDGIPRIFAEYVPGGDLRGWVRDGRLYRGGHGPALARILDIAIQFAWGLHHAHEHRVIHQDVKPANLMLTEDGVAKVADFGLAHAKGVAAAPPNRGPDVPASKQDDDTIVVEWAGCTPRYASPEQMATTNLTRRTDVWSWAVSVLEMLNGGCTWESGPAGGHHLSILRANGPARPQVPKLPDELADLLAECFRHEERDRPRTLLDVSRRLIDIHAVVCGRPYARPSPNARRDMADNLNNRAISLLDLGRDEQARRSWDGALRAQPHHPESTYNAGLLDWREGRLNDDELVKRLEEGREAASSHDDVGLLLAEVHLERGDCEAARAAVRTSIATDANEGRARVVDQWAQRNLPRSRRCLRRFNHGESIFAVALARDGDIALSAGVGGDVRMWSVDSGDDLGKLSYHRMTVSALAVDAAGTLAASGDRNGCVVVWELSSGEVLHVYEEHFGTVDSLFLGADGRRLLTGGEDQLVRLWATDSRACLCAFRGLRGAVTATWLSRDASQIIAAGDDGLICVWHNEPESRPRTIQAQDGGVSSACVSEDERMVLAGGRDGGLALWELDSGRCLHQMEAHTGPVTGVALLGNAARALSAGLDGNLRLWDLEDGRCLHTFRGHRGQLTALAARPDTGVALCASHDGGLRLWTVEQRYEHRAPLVLCRLRTAEELVTSQLEYEKLLARARRVLALGDSAESFDAARRARLLPGYEQAAEAMVIWRTLCQKFAHTQLQAHWESASTLAHEGGVRSVVASSNGRMAITCGADGTVKRWELPDGECAGTIGTHEAPIGALDLSLDCRLAASGADDGTVRLWDVHGGECLRSTDAHAGPVTGVVLRHDSELLATAGIDGQLGLWDVLTGHRLRVLRGRAGAYHCATMSADGGTVIAGTDDGRIALWNIATGEARTLGNFDGHVGAVTSVHASEDGRELLTGGADGALILWDMARDVHLQRFSGGGPPITSVALSPDGEYALSGTRDGRPRLWRVTGEECVDALRAHQRGVTGVAFGHNRGLALIGDDEGTLKLWTFDWRIDAQADPGYRRERLANYLGVFLERQRPSGRALPRSRPPTAREVAAALARDPAPRWADEDFARLLSSLHFAGFAWLSPGAVRTELQSANAAFSPAERGSPAKAGEPRKAPATGWRARLRSPNP